MPRARGRGRWAKSHKCNNCNANVCVCNVAGNKRPWAAVKAASNYDVIEINDDSAGSIEEVNAAKSFYESDDRVVTWHSFSVPQVPKNFTKSQVFDVILDNVGQNLFIPAYFELVSDGCAFLVYGCSEALNSLNEKNLLCYSSDLAEPIKLVIGTPKMMSAINFKRLITKAVERNKVGTKLNMKNFCSYMTFDKFYFPLSHRRNQVYIRNLDLPFLLQNITSLMLSNNNLIDVDGFELVTTFKSLKELNLSENKIRRISSLTGCKGMTLKCLWLEGNPLCQNFLDPEEYVKTVKMIFPTILILDGVSLPKDNIPRQIRNFLCNLEGKELIDKFLKMYFYLYDSSDRKLLFGMYNENAIFTCACSSTLAEHIGDFFNRSKNLLKKDKHFKNGNFHVGSTKVLKCLCIFPETLHDPYSFTVDVPIFKDDLAVFTVSGIFKVPSENLAKEEPIIEFARTFVLTREAHHKYTIVNDMMNLKLPSQAKLDTAFKVTNLTQNKPSINPVGQLPAKVKQGLVKFFSKLTDLDAVKSERCLERFEWKFKEALQYFISLEKSNEISTLDDAFIPTVNLD